MPSTYAEEMRDLSLAEVAAGRKPLRRTEFGGTTKTATGCTDILVEIGRRGIDPSVVAATESITETGPKSIRLVFPSNVEVAALCARLHKSGRDGLEHIVNVSTSFAVSSRCVVLTRALEQAYWLPAGAPNTIAVWRAILGIAPGVSSADALTRLAAMVTPSPQEDPNRTVIVSDTGSEVKYKSWTEALLDYMARIELCSLDEVKFARTTNAAAQQYRASCQVAEHWTAALSLDPSGRAELIESGHCVEVELPQDRSGNLVLPLADEHTACKIKAGNAVRIVGQPGDPVVNATVTDIDYINDRLELTVRPSRGSKIVLDRMPAEVILAPAPFGSVGMPPNSASKWGTKWSSSPALDTIDMPVDLLLAGAPTDQERPED